MQADVCITCRFQLFPVFNAFVMTNVTQVCARQPEGRQEMKPWRVVEHRPEGLLFGYESADLSESGLGWPYEKGSEIMNK